MKYNKRKIKGHVQRKRYGRYLRTQKLKPSQWSFMSYKMLEEMKLIRGKFFKQYQIMQALSRPFVPLYGQSTSVGWRTGVNFLLERCDLSNKV